MDTLVRRLASLLTGQASLPAKSLADEIAIAINRNHDGQECPSCMRPLCQAIYLSEPNLEVGLRLDQLDGLRGGITHRGILVLHQLLDLLQCRTTRRAKLT